MEEHGRPEKGNFVRSKVPMPLAKPSIAQLIDNEYTQGRLAHVPLVLLVGLDDAITALGGFACLKHGCSMCLALEPVQMLALILQIQCCWTFFEPPRHECQCGRP